MQRWTRAAAAAFLAWSASPAAAQSVEDFYRGKNVRFLVGYGPGTGYDVYMRVVQRHIGKHIPGKPNVVPENMPGAGGLVMANYLYNVAPKDGTYVGVPLQDLVFNARIGNPGVKYDATKAQYLGGADTTRTTLSVMKKQVEAEAFRIASATDDNTFPKNVSTPL